MDEGSDHVALGPGRATGMAGVQSARGVSAFGRGQEPPRQEPLRHGHSRSLPCAGRLSRVSLRFSLVEGVLGLLAGLLEVALGLVCLAFAFHLLVAGSLASVFLGCALGFVLLVLQLVKPAHFGAPFFVSSSACVRRRRVPWFRGSRGSRQSPKVCRRWSPARGFRDESHDQKHHSENNHLSFLFFLGGRPFCMNSQR